MIPRTLADVAEWAARGESFDLPLREFLDGFYANPTVEALILEPMRLADVVRVGRHRRRIPRRDRGVAGVEVQAVAAAVGVHRPLVVPPVVRVFAELPAGAVAARRRFGRATSLFPKTR